MNKGTVEYEDVILPIADITLRDGGFFAIATGHGPLAEYHGPARIIGPDGLLVTQGGHINVPAVAKHQVLRLEMDLTPESPYALE